MKALIAVAVLSVAALAYADPSIQQLCPQENPFKQGLCTPDQLQALNPEFQPTDAVARAMTAPAALSADWRRDRFLCASVEGGLFKKSQGFLNIDQAYCSSDDECTLVDIGGFCGRAAFPKTVAEGYKTWIRSSDYNLLQTRLKEANAVCPQPVGLCMPATGSKCDLNTNKCVAKFDGWGHPRPLPAALEAAAAASAE